MTTQKNRFWIIVASKDHVKTGVEQGFAQACHGKAAPLRRMKKGDMVIYYSGKETFGKPEKRQEFTAIGRVADNDVHHFQMTKDFCPARRNISFFDSNSTSILPLIDNLEFIRNKKQWGYLFRRGFFEISENDFKLISSKMLTKEYAG